MGKVRGKPSYKVISMRVSEIDQEYLKWIRKRTKKSISDIIREAMKSYARNCGYEGQNSWTS